MIAGLGKKESKIDWTNFNFPPFLNLIHYDLNELVEPEKSHVLKLYISYLIFFVSAILNIFNNIIICMTVKISAIRIFYAMFNVILF